MGAFFFLKKIKWWTIGRPIERERERIHEPHAKKKIKKGKDKTKGKGKGKKRGRDARVSFWQIVC